MVLNDVSLGENELVDALATENTDLVSLFASICDSKPTNWLGSEESWVFNLQRLPHFPLQASPIANRVHHSGVELTVIACIHVLNQERSVADRSQVPAWHQVNEALLHDDGRAVVAWRCQRIHVEPLVKNCVKCCDDGAGLIAPDQTTHSNDPPVSNQS